MWSAMGIVLADSGAVSRGVKEHVDEADGEALSSLGCGIADSGDIPRRVEIRLAMTSGGALKDSIAEL